MKYRHDIRVFSVAMGIKPLGYPPNPPPSYSSVTGKADPDSEKKEEDSVQKKVGEPVKLPPKCKLLIFVTLKDSLIINRNSLGENNVMSRDF